MTKLRSKVRHFLISHLFSLFISLVINESFSFLSTQFIFPISFLYTHPLVFIVYGLVFSFPFRVPKSSLQRAYFAEISPQIMMITFICSERFCLGYISVFWNHLEGELLVKIFRSRLVTEQWAVSRSLCNLLELPSLIAEDEHGLLPCYYHLIR